MLADVRKMVQDAWEFFAPPLIYASVAALFFWYLCGSAPLARLTTGIVNSREVLFSSNTTALLEKYSLTALVPLIALFLISVIAYSLTRVVFGLAGLLPLNLITWSGSILESLTHTDSRWRQYLARYPGSSTSDLIDYAIAKARLEKRDDLLTNVDYWRKSSGHASQLFEFSKFLLVWTIGCAALSLVLPDATQFTYRRVALMLVVVISFGLVAACRHAFAVQQEAYAKLRTARVLLDSEVPSDREEAPSKDMAPVSNEDFKAWEQMRDQPWWRIGLRLMESSRMLKFYEYLPEWRHRSDKNLWLQAILQNNLNILWFIIGAVMIWLLSGLSFWLGLLLFVGYVSVTIIDCLIVGVMLAGTVGRTLVVMIKHRIPDELLELVPDSVLARLQPLDKQQYWLTAAAMRTAEAIVAIFLSRVLAAYFF